MTITISLAPEEVAHDVLVQALDWEAQDRVEAVEGVKLGIEAFEQGRYRRFSKFEVEQRAIRLPQLGN